MNKTVKNKYPPNIVNDSGRRGEHVLEKSPVLFFALASTARMKKLTDRQF